MKRILALSMGLAIVLGSTLMGCEQGSTGGGAAPAPQDQTEETSEEGAGGEAEEQGS